MNTLRKEISEIGWVGREKHNNKTVPNKCGRDFLYLALNYLYPEKYNPETNNPVFIDTHRLFGFPVPSYLAWTQIQFSRIAKHLQKEEVVLSINGQRIDSYFAFVWGNLFSRISYEEAIVKIEDCIESNVPCAVDISIGNGLMVLLDHVMFVYGYDEENLYVIDTHNVKGVGYELIDQSNHLYKLPKTFVRDRWSKFGRIWEVRAV